jgi:predicted MPP superfamily phosphohydrolase
VLHISDTHLAAGDRALLRFLRRLPETIGEIDIIAATGDLIENNDGIEPLTTALNGLRANIARCYVLGSHDYYQPRFQSYLKYFSDRKSPVQAPRAETAELERRLQEAGWIALTNRTEIIDSAAGAIRLAGVDDPFLERHSTTHIARSAGEALAIGLAHSPDVVSEWLLNGFDLVLTGHTHAGQVRIPGIGALVTNSTLPAALAGGLHRVGEGWLHVSPGLGTGRFAPIRFNCRPEVTVIEIAGGLTRSASTRAGG